MLFSEKPTARKPSTKTASPISSSATSIYLSIFRFFEGVLKGVFLDTPPKTNLEPQKLVSL